MLAPHLGAFHAAHPEINLAVDCGLWHGALEAEPDLVLEYKDDARADQTSVPIAHVHYAYFASREYLATYGVPTRFSDVINHRFVRHAAFGQQKETWNPKGVAVRQLVNPTLVTNASGTMVEAVRGGAGIGAMPTVVATLFPELVMLDLGPVAQPTLWLRHHASAVERGRVRRVVDWLTRIFDPAERPWYRREFVDPKDFPREQRAPGVRVTSDESRRSA
jgi:DNA-binding transcriptional LysR family regulator